MVHEVGYFEKPVFEMHEVPEELAALGDHVGFVQFGESRASGPLGPWSAFACRTVNGRLIPDVAFKLYDPFGSGGGLGRRLIAAVCAPVSIRGILIDFRPDVILLYAVPTYGLATALLAKYRGIPVCFRALDVSHKIRKSVFNPLVSLFETLVYMTVSSISTNNPSLTEYVQQKTLQLRKPIWHKPPLNTGMFSDLSTMSRNELRRLLGIDPSAHVIVYMGSFFYFSGLSDVLASMNEVGDSAVLLLVGGGEGEESLRQQVIKLGLEQRVVFTGFVPFVELPKFLKIADVAINPMKKSLVSNKAFPNKVIQYMAAGLPVVSVDLEGMVRVLGKAPALYLEKNPQKVWFTASSLAGMSELMAIGDTNRRHVEALFDYRRDLANLRAHLHQLVETRKRTKGN